MRWSYGRPTLIGLGLLGSLLIGEQLAAQQDFELSVRPREMATGTRTNSAGRHLLDWVLDTPPWDEQEIPTLYVPPQCVGARRCPLVVATGRFQYRYVEQWTFELADKYGVLVLSMLWNGWEKEENPPRVVAMLNAALTRTLREFAVDPDRIAFLAGESGPLFLARSNVQVFSRIMSLQPVVDADLVLPPVKSPGAKGYYFIQGTYGSHGSIAASFTVADTLLREGHTVLYGIALKPHAHRRITYETAFKWFQETWADPKASPSPFFSGAAPMPLLTPEAIAKLDTFWLEFRANAPDSLWKIPDSLPIPSGLEGKAWANGMTPFGLQGFIRQVLLPVGQLQAAFEIVDIPALAAAYPDVAAALEVAGLTAQEAAAYRAAFLSAWSTFLGNASKEFYGSRRNTVQISPRTVADSASVLGKNVAVVASLSVQGGDGPTLPNDGLSSMTFRP